MKRLGLALLLAALVGLTALLITKVIGVGIFGALGTLWLAGSLVLMVGPETISEIKVWKASIKRDVKAAQEIRNEVESVRNELRHITKMLVEDAYILGSSSFLAMGAEQAARKRLEKNMDELSKFAEPIKEKEHKWWAELQELFATRRQ